MFALVSVLSVCPILKYNFHAYIFANQILLMLQEGTLSTSPLLPLFVVDVTKSCDIKPGSACVTDNCHGTSFPFLCQHSQCALWSRVADWWGSGCLLCAVLSLHSLPLFDWRALNSNRRTAASFLQCPLVTICIDLKHASQCLLCMYGMFHATLRKAALRVGVCVCMLA